MGRFKQIIQENKEAGNLEVLTPRIQEVKQPRKQDSEKTRKLESLKAEMREIQESIKEEKKRTEGGIAFKVDLELRNHWVAEAKRQGTTITAVMIEALTERFGTPHGS